MSELKVIYLGPTCQEQADGREWCKDDVWERCECGDESVRYVIGSELDRVTAERDALQLLLNDRDEQLHTLEQSRRAHFENAQAAERRIDELTSAVRSINRSKHHEVYVPGDDEPQYRQRKEWIDWVLSLCDGASASERDQGIPGTSFQRLNMLANQGE